MLQMKELHSLGFKDRAQCEAALRQSGGDLRGALSVLQQPLLEPFRQRVWSTQPEAPIDLDNPDKQVWALFTHADNLPSCSCVCSDSIRTFMCDGEAVTLSCFRTFGGCF